LDTIGKIILLWPSRLEENKMAVKFAFDGPRGKRINTRKRVKLILGFFGDSIVKHIEKLRAQAVRKDRYLEIYFFQMRRVKIGEKA